MSPRQHQFNLDSTFGNPALRRNTRRPAIARLNRGGLVFGTWNLGFFWGLVFGAWSFSLNVSAPGLSGETEGKSPQCGNG
jgi:hypothetical protein